MMDHATLRTRHADAIRRNWRTMDDRDGHVPERLLDELTAIADEHALDEQRLPDDPDPAQQPPAARTRARNRRDDPAAA